MIPNSPADIAGLLPYGDYIIGTPEGIVHGESGLGELVEDYLLRPLRLYVYNHEYSVTRIITITPSRSWGGEGALGCVLGFGALHHLPLPLTEPPAAPGDTLFESASFSNEESRPLSSQTSLLPANDAVYRPPSAAPDLLIPAIMPTPPPLNILSGSSTAAARGGRKPRHGISPNRAFDEYFKESEQKSKEEDLAPKAKATPPPPPPKVGSGPPQSRPPMVGANESHSKSSGADVAEDKPNI